MLESRYIVSTDSRFIREKHPGGPVYHANTASHVDGSASRVIRLPLDYSTPMYQLKFRWDQYNQAMRATRNTDIREETPTFLESDGKISFVTTCNCIAVRFIAMSYARFPVWQLPLYPTCMFFLEVLHTDVVNIIFVIIRVNEWVLWF